MKTFLSKVCLFQKYIVPLQREIKNQESGLIRTEGVLISDNS